MKASKVRWLAGLLVAALAISGCYGSTRPVIKIGLIAPFEELYRDDGYEVLNAVKLAVNQRNAAGGVAGHQVALVALNDNGRPEEAQQQAAKMAVDADVMGVIGPVKAGSAAAAQSLTERQMPWIALTELPSAELVGGFSLALSPETVGGAAVAALMEQPGIDSALVLTDWPEARAAAEAAGATVYSLAATEQVAAQAGQGVVWLGDAEQGARLAAALGPEATMTGGSEMGSHIVAGRAGNKAASGHWLSAAPAAEQMPQRFVEEYRALAGGDPGPQAILAYDAANLLLDAIDLAGAGGAGRERDAVQQALLALGTAGWQGAGGMIRWDAGCDPDAGCGRNFDGLVYQHAVR